MSASVKFLFFKKCLPPEKLFIISFASATVRFSKKPKSGAILFLVLVLAKS